MVLSFLHLFFWMAGFPLLRRKEDHPPPPRFFNAEMPQAPRPCRPASRHRAIGPCISCHRGNQAWWNLVNFGAGCWMIFGNTCHLSGEKRLALYPAQWLRQLTTSRWVWGRPKWFQWRCWFSRSRLQNGELHHPIWLRDFMAEPRKCWDIVWV